MSRISTTKREVEYVDKRLRRLASGEIDPDVTRAILKLKDLTLKEVGRVTGAAVEGGADQKEADRLAVFALVCKFLLIQRAFDEANRYERIVRKHQKRGRMTLAQKIKGRNADMAKQYRVREPVVGCLGARQELSQKWEISLRQVTNALRAQGVEIKKRKSE